MEVGSLVVVDGLTAEVVAFTPGGDVRVRDISTLKLKWVDYYLCEVVDPNKDGEALLTALGALHDMADSIDEAEVGDDVETG
jgi:hypothetical protein